MPRSRIRQLRDNYTALESSASQVDPADRVHVEFRREMRLNLQAQLEEQRYRDGNREIEVLRRDVRELQEARSRDSGSPYLGAPPADRRDPATH